MTAGLPSFLIFSLPWFLLLPSLFCAASSVLMTREGRMKALLRRRQRVSVCLCVPVCVCVCVCVSE